jgi:hypothetical protein
MDHLLLPKQFHVEEDRQRLLHQKLTVPRRGRPPKTSTPKVSQVSVTPKNTIPKVTKVSPLRRPGRPRKEIHTPGM